MSNAPPTLSLTDHVAERIRCRLVEGELTPGQRLSEVELSQSLQVSRNTLREAFRMLTKEGLLRHEHNRGVSVATPSLASVMDIYRVRRIIECQALAQAYPKHPGGLQMRQAVLAAQQACEQQDWQSVGTANMRFHTAIVALADSERLNTLFAHLLTELRLVFGMLSDPEFLHAPYVDQNARILAAFESGAYAEAATLLNEYLVQSERIILAEYARQLAATGESA